MTIFQSIVLGLVQGIGEFLPISSSGHLKVAQELFRLDDVPLLFDVFLHLATLLAVVIYFRPVIMVLYQIAHLIRSVIIKLKAPKHITCHISSLYRICRGRLTKKSPRFHRTTGRGATRF